jgi:hypothetical protein
LSMKQPWTSPRDREYAERRVNYHEPFEEAPQRNWPWHDDLHNPNTDVPTHLRNAKKKRDSPGGWSPWDYSMLPTLASQTLKPKVERNSTCDRLAAA